MTLQLDPGSDPPLPSNARRWIGRGVWAIADQGLFASSNFLLNLLLARWLTGAEFGAFVVALFLFLLLATTHNGLLVEPMLVFGPADYRRRLPMYRAALLQLQALFSVPLAALLLIGAALAAWLRHPDLALALAVLAAAGPAILFLWLMRRVCYLHDAPRRAAVAGLAYTALMLGAIFLLERSNRLGIASALATMGVCSALSAVGLMLSEKVRWPAADQRDDVRQVRQRHLRYGRWASTAGLMGFLPAQAYYLLLPLLVSTQAAGTLRGLSIPILPLQQATAALSMLLLPRLSRLHGSDHFPRTVRRVLWGLVGAAVLYWLICGLLHAPLIRLLYGDDADNGAFAAHSRLLWLIALQPVLQAVNAVYSAAVVATQRPDRNFYAQLASSVVALTVGVVLAHRYGVGGAAVAILINLAVQAVVLGYYVRKPASPLTDEPRMDMAIQPAAEALP